jgi:hypothetical protein
METREKEDKNMMITLKGFKGEVDERWHIMPICDKT